MRSVVDALMPTSFRSSHSSEQPVATEHVSTTNEGRQPQIRLRWPVKRIVRLNADGDEDGKHNLVRIECADETRSFLATHVVLAVPYPILRLGLITFQPPLPPDKHIGAGFPTDPKTKESLVCGLTMAQHAIKILLCFSRRPYPMDCHGLVDSDGLIPEFWMHDLTDQGKGYAVTGFAMSGAAERLLSAAASETADPDRRNCNNAAASETADPAAQTAETTKHSTWPSSRSPSRNSTPSSAHHQLVTSSVPRQPMTSSVPRQPMTSSMPRQFTPAVT
jgi:hypothetical protein